MELGKKIKQLRFKAGLTQEQLAERLGIGPQSVSKWENAVSMPDITALPLLAEIFGTGVLGGLCAYPIATLFMNVDAAAVAFYAYIIPFLISTTGGSIIAGLVIAALQSGGTLSKMQARLDA
jgi:transcriptional regulator with XRE-family HTH domain